MLVHESKQSRFDTPKGKLSAEAKNEMLSYARSIALLRLEAQEIQELIAELQGQIKTQKFDDAETKQIHERLYAGVESTTKQPKQTGVLG